MNPEKDIQEPKNTERTEGENNPPCNVDMNWVKHFCLTFFSPIPYSQLSGSNSFQALVFSTKIVLTFWCVSISLINVVSNDSAEFFVVFFVLMFDRSNCPLAFTAS